MWKGPREFFTYTTTQRNGILAFTALIFILWGSFLWFDFSNKPSQQDFSEFEEQIKKWESEEHKRNSASHSLFNFDPNTASDSNFYALGLGKNQLRVLRNYQKKGGRFNRPEDLMGVYGVDTSWFYKVKDYIHIDSQISKKEVQSLRVNLKTFNVNTATAEQLNEAGLKEWETKRIMNYRKAFGFFKEKEELHKLYGFDSLRVEEILPFVETIVDTNVDASENQVMLIELNSADSLSLLNVSGIGPTFAKRIIKYKNRLGGFYSKEQLKEVYGMEDEYYLKMKGQLNIDDTQLRKIDIHKADFKTLLKHPYLSYDQVKDIVEFRENIRHFKNLEELKGLESITEEDFVRLRPYLKL